MDLIEGGSGVPEEPDWGSIYADEFDVAMAHEFWGVATRELQSNGVLSVANGHAVKRLVDFRVQYERAARQVAEVGPVAKSTRKRGNKTGQWNPYWSVMRQADEAVRVLEAELGIPPVRRGKATKVLNAKKTVRAADKYLKAVPKPAAG